MSMIVRPSTKEDIDYLYTVIDKDRLDEWMGEKEWYLAVERNWRIAEDKNQDVFLMKLYLLHRDDPYPDKYIFRTGGKTMMFREEAYSKYGITYMSADFPMSIDEAVAIIKNIWMAASTYLSGWGEDAASQARKEDKMSVIAAYTFFMSNTKQ